MRELRLKYLIQMVSDIASKAKTDEKALTMAQKAVQDALKQTGHEAGALERVMLRMATIGARGVDAQAQRLANLAMRYQDVRKAAEGAAQTMERVARVGAAGAAGVYAIDRMAAAPMDYNLRLAHMANTAFADRNAAGRIAGKQTLNAAITAAIRTGGGSRDDAAGALDKMIARNAIPTQSAIGVLPFLMKTSTASGATGQQLASIALTGMQSSGISQAQVPELLNMAVAAGQAGGFELKDMARYLPELMAMGKQTGLTGLEGVRRILASLQGSIITSGTPEAAATNTLNLLGKMTAQDTANDFKKLGIDLPGVLAKQARNGVNSMDAFVGLVGQVVSKDPRYAAVSKQLAKEKDLGQETQSTEAMRAIFQGAGIGKVVQDRQALLGLVAEISNAEEIRKVMAATRSNTGAIGTSFDVVSQEVAFQRQRALNEGAIASDNAFNKVAPALNAVASTATDVAQRFPGVATGAALATAALAVFTAALGASGLVGLLTGRAGAAGGVLGTAGTVAAGTASAGLRSLVKGTGATAGYLRMGALGLGSLIGGGIDAYTVANDPTLTEAGRKRGYANAGAGTAGSMIGGTVGAGIGTFLLPGPGTFAGMAVGSVVGNWVGKLGLDWLWGQDPARDLVPGAGGDLAVMSPGGGAGLGQGTIDVRVSVSDERIGVDLAMQGTPALALNSGNTNPGGYSSISPAIPR